MAAIAAVDLALWDIKAKVAGMPLYQLLGGASRNGLLAYGHASRTRPARPVRFDRRAPRGRLSGDQGPVGRPRAAERSTASPPPSEGERYDYEPRTPPGLPVEEDWDTRAYLRHIPTVFEAVRAKFGPELPLLHDAHHRLTPIQAARLGKSLEPFDLFWLEDCTPAENQAGLRLVREHTTTPLAIGEVFNTVWDYQQLISEQLIDYVRSSVTHAGGISPMKRLMDFAAMFQIKSGMHGPTDISPVGMAAALHLGLAIHNFGIQEYMRHSPATMDVFRTSLTFEGGLLHPGDQPGLGVSLDDGAAAAYPYVQAYLPDSRLADGTVHDW